MFPHSEQFNLKSGSARCRYNICVTSLSLFAICGFTVYNRILCVKSFSAGKAFDSLIFTSVSFRMYLDNISVVKLLHIHPYQATLAPLLHPSFYTFLPSWVGAHRPRTHFPSRSSFIQIITLHIVLMRSRPTRVYQYL